jgi:hypothetical protein
MATGEEIKRELEAFYQGYIDAFNREDLDHFLGCFAIPYAWITGERGLLLTSSETDHEKAFSKIMIEIKARGWARSGIDQLKTWAYGDNLGMIVADYTRYKADNSILEQGRACYTVRRGGRSWQIVALSEVKPGYLGPGDLAR